jgi:hypothetical protein
MNNPSEVSSPEPLNLPVQTYQEKPQVVMLTTEEKIIKGLRKTCRSLFWWAITLACIFFYYSFFHPEEHVIQRRIMGAIMLVSLISAEAFRAFIEGYTKISK